MVFLGGPRQVGRTTLAKTLISEGGPFAGGAYFNWDNDEDRKRILQKSWLQTGPLVVFDELHKYSRWKQWMKGVYDSKQGDQQYMVTGSARLDVYKRGGDSLLGRYHYWRLHPFTLDELPPHIAATEGYERLLELGGFPEPFLSGNEREARRWRRERFDRVLREDIQSLELIRDIQMLSLFVDALRERVGGMVTFANIAQDLQIAPVTAKNWLNVLEKMYLVFPVYPLTRNVPRAIQKPPKVYFFDNADVLGDRGARLENLVATTLLKRLHFIEDYYGYRCSLHYIRDKEGREVDFVTVIDNVVEDLIEVKNTDDTISHSLKYYSARLKPKRTVQLVGNIRRAFQQGDIIVMNPVEFFKDPPWITVH